MQTRPQLVFIGRLRHLTRFFWRTKKSRQMTSLATPLPPCNDIQSYYRLAIDRLDKQRPSQSSSSPFAYNNIKIWQKKTHMFSFNYFLFFHTKVFSTSKCTYFSFIKIITSRFGFTYIDDSNKPVVRRNMILEF